MGGISPQTDFLPVRLSPNVVMQLLYRCGGSTLYGAGWILL